MIDDHTFGNHNSKRSLLEVDELIKVTEAANGNAIGEENAIIRPSGSRTSFKQVSKAEEDIAPSNSTANEDNASVANLMPNASTAIQSSLTNMQKQDSQQQTPSVLIDVSLGASSGMPSTNNGKVSARARGIRSDCRNAP